VIGPIALKQMRKPSATSADHQRGGDRIRQPSVIPSGCAIGPSSPKPGILQIACESTEEADSVPYMGNRGFAGMNVGVDRAEKLGRDGLLWRSGFQADRGES
jgi:hypothetical protein